MIASMEDGSKTPKQADLEFRKRISKKQLEDILTDDSLDASDITACKEMLKDYFNYQLTIN